MPPTTTHSGVHWFDASITHNQTKRNLDKDMIKIKFDDASYILGYKSEHFFKHYFCSWLLEDYINSNAHTIRCRIKIWIYAFLMIPVNFANLFVCAWNGIKENYELITPTVETHYLPEDDISNGRAIEVKQKRARD